MLTKTLQYSLYLSRMLTLQLFLFFKDYLVLEVIVVFKTYIGLKLAYNFIELRAKQCRC